jgi:hypothetical protein
MDKITITRGQLYDLIWSKPTTTLAKEFGLSDNGLRKICKNFNIPLPYLGYWAKLKHGKPARKVGLPTSFTGKDEIIFEPLTENRVVNQKEISARTTLIKEIGTKHKHLLEVPLRLTNPDALVIKAKDALTANKTRWIDHGLISTSSGFVVIKVAPENVARALRFIDTLIKLLKARGYEVNADRDSSHLVIFGEPLVIRLQEKLRFEDNIEGKYNWKTRHYYPTGIFMLKCWRESWSHQRIWIDGKELIESQLAKIVAGIELLAMKERTERLEREERWRKDKEKQRIEKERHDREALDGANFQKLLAQSKIWKQSQILYEFISEVESNAIASGELTDECKGWIMWAKEKAEKLNPLNNIGLIISR